MRNAKNKLHLRKNTTLQVTSFGHPVSSQACCWIWGIPMLLISKWSEGPKDGALSSCRLSRKSVALTLHLLAIGVHPLPSGLQQNLAKLLRHTSRAAGFAGVPGSPLPSAELEPGGTKLVVFSPPVARFFEAAPRTKEQEAPTARKITKTTTSCCPVNVICKGNQKEKND